MGFTKPKSNSNKTLFVLEPRDKDENKEKVDPFFEVKEIKDKKGIPCDNQRGLTATFNGVTVKEKVINPPGKKPVVYDEISVRLSDDTANYILSLRFRMDTRSLLNSLLNAKVGQTVTVEIYRSKGGYLSYSLKDAKDQRIDWKYSKEQIPERDPVMIRGEIQSYDYKAIDDFFKKALLETFGGEKTETEEAESNSDNEEKDSIPF